MTKVDNLLDKLKKDFGPDKVYRSNEAPDVEIISTGSVSLDFATGVGGIPKGTIVEIFGRESVGKTGLAYAMIAQVQKQGGVPVFINLEGNYDADWAARSAGVKPEDLVVIAPAPGSEAVTALAKVVNSGAADLVVFDSVGAMVGDNEQIPGEKKQAGGQSALVTHMVKMIAVPASANGTTVVFLNQIRAVFSSMYPMEESPGGMAVKHMAALRIHLKPGKEKYEGIVHGEKMQIGFRVNALVKKNKVGAPRQVAGWNFWNYPNPQGVVGIDNHQEIIDLAMRLNIITRAGAYFTHEVFEEDKNGKRQIQGAANVADFLLNNPEAQEKVRKEVLHAASKVNNKQS